MDLNAVELFLTCQGGGPEGDRLAGAMAGAHFKRKGKRFAGYAGSSIGAINSAFGAFHIDDDAVRMLYRKYLQKNKLLDSGLRALSQFHLLDWTIIGELTDKTFGKNAKLGDAISSLVIVVTSLDHKKPVYLSKKNNPNVLLSEALRASSAFLPRITGSQKIQSLGSSLSPDRRLFIDAGWTDNTADHVFDYRGPRIALRLEEEEPERIRTIWEGGTPFEQDIATFKCALWASSQPKTKRTDGIDVMIRRGIGWDFSKSEEEINSSWSVGYKTAVQQIEEVNNGK